MAIARVQTTKAGTGSTVTSLGTSAFSSSTTTGNTIVVFIRSPGDSDVTSVTDTIGNIYAQQASQEATNPSIWAFACVGISGGSSQVVTVNFSALSGAYVWICASEYSGVTSIDSAATGARTAGAATDLTSTAFSTAAAAEMVTLGVSQNNFAAYTAGTDFTLVDGLLGGVPEFFGGVEEYLTTGTLSSYTAHITSDTSAAYSLAWVSLGGDVGAALPALQSRQPMPMLAVPDQDTIMRIQGRSA